MPAALREAIVMHGMRYQDLYTPGGVHIKWRTKLEQLRWAATFKIRGLPASMIGDVSY